MKIIIFLLQISLALTESQVNINKPYFSKILDANYKFESDDLKSKMYFTINGNKYRESIAFPNTDTYFAMPIKNDKLNISFKIEGKYNYFPKFNYQYINGFVLPNINLKEKDLLINKNNKQIFENEYYFDRKHILNLRIMLSFKPYSEKEKSIITSVYFNGDLKKSNILTVTNPGISYNLKLNGEPGLNIINVFSQSDGIWCNCPKIGNGFQIHRYFMGWMTPIDDEDMEYLRISEKNNIELTVNDHILVSDFSYIPVSGLIVAI
jgi:hypothetical protein